MLLGRYFHTAMLEPEKLVSEEFTSIDVASRNSKKYKEEILGYGRALMMLDKEKAEIDKAISVMKNNLELFEDIYDDRFYRKVVDEKLIVKSSYQFQTRCIFIVFLTDV